MTNLIARYDVPEGSDLKDALTVHRDFRGTPQCRQGIDDDLRDWERTERSIDCRRCLSLPGQL